jgi:hypothetical protein
LLVEHAAAYASLFGEELAIGSARLRRQLALQVVGLACLMVAAVLLGVGVLLWAALPDDAARVLWLFGITPGLPALLGLWAFWLAGREVTRCCLPVCAGSWPKMRRCCDIRRHRECHRHSVDFSDPHSRPWAAYRIGL